MILPDVNLLIYAYRRAAPEHQATWGWLQTVISGPEPLALTDATASGLIRIVTNPRIHALPAPAMDAVGFVDDLLASPSTLWLGATPAVWERMRTLVDNDPGIRGSLVPDAFLAATAIAHGARLASADRGMARFPGLKLFNPLTTQRG